MKKKKTHISQKLEDKYPNATVPVEDAWAAMKGMLDQGLPVSNAHGFNEFKWLKAAKLISVLALTSVGLSYVFVKYQKEYLPFQTKTEIRKLAQSPKTPLSDEDKELARSVHSSKFDTKSNDSTEKFAFNSVIRDLAKQGTEPSVLPNHEDADSKNSGDGNRKILNEKSKAYRQKNPVSNTLPNVSESTDTKIVKNNSKKSKRLDKEIDSNQKPDFPVNSKANRSKFIETSQKLNDAKEGKWVSNGKIKNPQRNFAETGNRADFYHNPGNAVSKLPEQQNIQIAALATRKASELHFLQQKFKAISIMQPAREVPAIPVKWRNKDFAKSIHAGLLWNLNIPQSGYDLYFRGTRNKNDFYKILIPGIWISKTINNGSEVLFKVRFNDQYFGSTKRLDSLNFQRRDSAENIYLKSKLIKISGFNAGIQYNQRLNDKFFLGFGTSLQWQHKALLNQITTVSDSTKSIDYSFLNTITQKTDTANYLKSFFLSANVEIVYTWKRFRLGAGLAMPVSSMTSSPYIKQRPIAGQLIFRWKFR